MTAQEKYRVALALSRAIMAKRSAEREIADLSAKLSMYIEETGDDILEWPNRGLKLTYVRGSAPGTTTDYKRFTTLAAGYMSANDYESLLARCAKKTAGRKPSFR